jgi:LCP family protein required for cell wall assembly
MPAAPRAFVGAENGELPRRPADAARKADRARMAKPPRSAEPSREAKPPREATSARRSLPPRAALEADPRSFVVDAPLVPDVEIAPVPPTGLPPGGEPPSTDRPGRPRRRWVRRVKWTLIAVLSVLTVLTLAFIGLGWRSYRRIDRVPVKSALTEHTGGGTNYLIVGSDSREGIAADDPNAEVFGGDLGTSRTDTIVVLHVGDDGNLMLPLPRDLFIPIVGGKGRDRINTAIQHGPDKLIQTVQQSLGVPVHHYIEMDFVGFLELVDAVGGVEIDFDAPAFDENSGLDIKEAGRHSLDRDQALAYVRSRHYTRVIDGKKVVDPTADLGRITRQQTFFRAVMKKVGDTRHPVTLLRIADGVAAGLHIDDALGFRDLIGLARKLGGLDPETVELPVKPTTTAGGAAVLLLNEPSAQAALDRVRH